MLLHFTKMHGLGNDFVVFDLLSQNASLTSEQIRYIADRRRGIGCDQVLLVEPPNNPNNDFHYRIFNCDGNEVEQCGNGARCFGKFVYDKKLTGKQQLRVSTNTGTIGITLLDNDKVQVDMGQAIFDPVRIPFVADQQADRYTLIHDQGQSEISAVSMGNPHAVLLVDNVETAPVHSLGALLEQHERFPEKVNVGFMQRLSSSAIKLRVFERGVGETQACGSGACAAVVCGQQLGLLDETVDVELRGGKLSIQCRGDNDSVLMTGDACKVYDGKIIL